MDIVWEHELNAGARAVGFDVQRHRHLLGLKVIGLGAETRAAFGQDDDATHGTDNS